MSNIPKGFKKVTPADMLSEPVLQEQGELVERMRAAVLKSLPRLREQFLDAGMVVPSQIADDEDEE